MMRDLVAQIEFTEPTIGQMQRYVLAEPAFVPDPVTIANEQHVDHQLGIEGWTTNVAVERPQATMQIGKGCGDKDVQPPQQMVRRDHVVEIELIEQLPLLAILPPHHRRPLPLSCAQLESPFGIALNPFFDSINQKQRSFNCCNFLLRPGARLGPNDRR